MSLVVISDGKIVSNKIMQYPVYGTFTILANQNSVTVTHNAGFVPTSIVATGGDDNANVFIVDTITSSQATIKLQGGITQPNDVTGYYIGA